MGRKCQVTGAKPAKGRKYTMRGIAKKKKGIGLNTTGIASRRFLPNLVKKRFWFADENRFVMLRLTTKAMRTSDKLGLASVIKQMRARGEKV